MESFFRGLALDYYLKNPGGIWEHQRVWRIQRMGNNVTLSPLNVKELNQLQGIKLKLKPIAAENSSGRKR